MRLNMPQKTDVIEQTGLRVFSLPAALIAASPAYFAQHATDARTALSLIADATDVVRRLLEGGHSAIAGRLAAAFRNIGHERIANDIVAAMQAADYEIREQDPFLDRIDFNLPRRELSPYAGCIRLLQMREAVIKTFPAPPGQPNDVDAYLRHVEDVYVTDAYHSLSIEGYRVSVELIERVRRGNWNPDADEHDRKHADAVVALGYWQAFQEVKKACAPSLRTKIQAPSRMKVTLHGIAKCSLPVSPQDSCGGRVLPDIAIVKLLSAAPCMFHRPLMLYPTPCRPSLRC
jgi:hypothetical protein